MAQRLQVNLHSTLSTVSVGCHGDLVKALKNQDRKAFIDILNKDEVGSSIDVNTEYKALRYQTCLDFVCAEGKLDLVEVLLESGADPNKINKLRNKPPLHAAAEKGHHEIIRCLLNHGADVNIRGDQNRMALHVAVEQLALAGLRKESDSKQNLEIKRMFLQCIQALLENSSIEIDKSDNEGKTPLHLAANLGGKEAVELLLDYDNNMRYSLTSQKDEGQENHMMKKLNINSMDSSGNTPLHYAAKNGDKNMIATFIRHGAYVGLKNKNNEPTITCIDPNVLEEILDDCLLTNNEPTGGETYKIIFEYDFLNPQRKYTSMESEKTRTVLVPEAEPLLHMSKSEQHKHLLKHPLITSFLFLKWHRIRWFFYGNLIFYTIFVTCLTYYLLTLFGTEYSVVENYANRTNGSNITFQGITGASLKRDYTHHALRVSWIIVSVVLAFLVIREIFQFGVSAKNYLSNFENWFEVGLIVMSSVIMYTSYDDVKQHLSAIVVLLLWTELVLLIGRHPSLSTYITMFTTVSHSFMFFLLWFSLFILAFTFSFFILFHRSEENGKNFFRKPGNALLKTFVMMTGEFGIETLPFGSCSITSHIIFILFMFLITVVLMNLLNGLAVSDTQAIKLKAEVVSLTSRVELISYIEIMLLSNPFQFIRNSLPSCCLSACRSLRVAIEKFRKSVLLFPGILQNGHIKVFPNKNAKISPSTCDNCKGCSKCTMPKEIVQSAKNIFAKKEHKSKDEEIKFELETLKQMLSNLQEKLKSMDKKS